jgi:hypothetical protein
VINLHPADIHSDYPADDEEGEIDTTSIPPAVEDRDDTTSIPPAVDKKGDTTLPAVDERSVTTLISPAVDEKIETTSIPPTVDEKGDTSSIPRGIYPIVSVGGVMGVMTGVLLGCLAVKKKKKKSTKKPLRGVLASSSQCDMDEDSCASPVSVQESHDANCHRTGSIEELCLEDDDVECGNSILISNISSSSECEDTTSTEKNLGTPGPLRSVFPAGAIASILNMAGIAFLKSIQKSRSEKAAAPWQAFDSNDSSWESHGSVSENNVRNDDMSSSASSVYIEDTDINDSDSDGSSISSHRDWKDAQSMDNTIVWSFSATHIGDTCEMGEI